MGANPFSVSGGVLDITAQTASTGSNPYGLGYTSGIINSRTLFSQEYGYFETRAKMPAGAGMWSAFWMLPTTDVKSTSAELDVFEILGRLPTLISETTHSATDGTNYGYVYGADATKAFHTYGVDWEPSTITFYIDRVAVKTIATPSNMHNPMYMMLNLAVGTSSSWAGAPTSSSEFPASLQIDYVRAYATANTTKIGGTGAIATSTGTGGTGTGSTGTGTGSTGTGSTTITLGKAQDSVTKGAGNYTVTGTNGYYTVTLGNGNQNVALGGWANTVTVGNGTSTISTGKGYARVQTGTGVASISAHGNANVFDAGGTSTITVDTGTVHNTFVTNAAGGGVATINGYSLASYDTLDLTRTLAGTSIKSDLSNIDSFITSSVSGGSTTLYVDPTGGTGTRTAFAVLNSVSTTVNGLLASNDFKVG